MNKKTKLITLATTIISSLPLHAQNVVQWDMSSAASSTNTAIATGLNITTGAGLSASYSGGIGTFTHNGSLQSLADAQAANAYIDFTINVAAWDASNCSISTANNQLTKVSQPDRYNFSSTTQPGTALNGVVSQNPLISNYGNIGGNASTLGGPTITGTGVGGTYNYRLYVYDDAAQHTLGITELNNVTLSFNGADNHGCAQVVPEPSSAALLGLGSLALMLRRKRK